MTESSLLQEIEEDMQRRKVEALWKRYGTYILAAALAIVLATVSYTSWHKYHAEKQQAATAALLQILNDTAVDHGKQADDLKKFAADYHGTNQAALAQLDEAAIAMKDGQTAKAIALYDALAQDASAEGNFRQLADLMAVQAQLDNGDPVALLKRLQPLMAADAVWPYIAKEYAAHLALRGGDKAQAIKLFTELSQDPGTPPTAMVRVIDMLHWLNQGK